MKVLAAVLALGLSALLPAPLRAAESFDGCQYTVTSLPAVLTTQGVWCLENDLATGIASGVAITIAANNITLDCNHFKVGGLAAGTATEAFGIGGQSRSNVTIRRCNVRGFLYGLRTDGFINPTVEDNIFEFSTFAGVYMAQGDNTTIRRNRVSEIGDSTAPGVVHAVGIFVEHGSAT